MEKSVAEKQPSIHMFTTTQDLQELSGKFTKIFKLQSSGLSPPTFTPNVISRFLKVLNQAKTALMQNKSNHPDDIVALMAPFIPQIVELSSQNFLSRTIREFQGEVSKLNNHISLIVESTESSQDSRSPIFRISNAVAVLMPKVLILSFDKVTSSSFNEVQRCLQSVQTEIGTLREVQNYEQYQELSEIANDLELSIKHITAAHSFIAISGSLQDSIRHFTLDKAMKTHVLHNVNSKIHPSRPRDENIQDFTTCEQLLQEFINNPNKNNEEEKNKFIEVMKSALKRDLKFESCTPGIESIVFVILTIQPPHDPAKKVFSKCNIFYYTAARAITQLYKLPDFAYSYADIELFVKALDSLKQAIDSIVKARKKPVGWSAQDTKYFMKCTEPFTKLDNILRSSVDLVQRANEAVGQQVFRAEIGKVIPKPISMRFFIPEEDEKITKQMKKFNIIRGIALSQKMLVNLGEKQVILRGNDTCIKPADFTHLFARIRGNIGQIEKELFQRSLINSNGIPSSKSNTTMVSSLSEMPLKLEEYILTMGSLPIEIASLREISMILYEQGFSLSIDQIFNAINNDINLMFEVYQVYEHLDRAGAANLSTCAQLSFLATTTSELSTKYTEFQPFADYFNSLNVFELNMDEILETIGNFREVATNFIMKWACPEIINSFSQQYKSTYTAANIVRNEPLDPLCSKLIGQLTGWLSKLPRVVPKQSNIRDMHIRMIILKTMLDDYLKNHPDCKARVHFTQIFGTIDLIGDFRRIFELKSILKSVLTFVERIETGSSKEIIVKDIELNPEEDSQIVAQGSQVQEYENFDLDKIKFNREERSQWSKFSNCIFTKSISHVHDQYSKYTDDMVKKRQRAVLSEFNAAWNAEECAPFEKDLQDMSNDILNNRDVTLSSTFIKKVITTLQKMIDSLLSQLIEFSPPSRGRGYPRENPPHPKSQQIGELYKIISSIKNMMNENDFSWVSEFLDSRSTALELFEITDITSQGKSPIVLLRDISNKAFAFFRFVRCIYFVKGGDPIFDNDLKMLKILVAGLAKKTRFVKENSPLLFHEIDQVVKSNANSNYCNFKTSMKVLMRSRGLYEVKDLVTKVDEMFFDFYNFFTCLPYEFSTLTSFLHSTVFDLYRECSHSIVLRYIESGFSNDFIIEHFHYMLNFKKEFDLSPVKINWERLNDNISTVLALQHLVDVSLAFDCVKPLVKLQDNENMIQGTDFLSIELLIFKLQDEIESLVQSKPSLLCNLYINLTKVLTSLRVIPNKFGPRNINNKYMLALKEQWINFVENFASLPMEKFTEVFVHISNQIIDGIQENVESEVIQNDLKTIIFTVKQYSFLPTKDTLERIEFGLLYIAAATTKSPSNNKVNDLPFFQLNVIISAMLSMYKICELIPIITKKFEIAMHCTIPHNIPTISVPKKTDKEMIPEPIDGLVNLPELLSFADQTAVGHMTAALFDANLADQEKIASVPLMKRKIERDSIVLESFKESNKRLEEINQGLMDKKEAAKMATVNKEAKEGPNEVENIFMQYSAVSEERNAKNAFIKAKREYEIEMESAETLIGIKSELIKSVAKKEFRKDNSVTSNRVNGYQNQIKNASSRYYSFEEKAKDILSFD